MWALAGILLVAAVTAFAGDRGTGSPENGGGWLQQRADHA